MLSFPAGPRPPRRLPGWVPLGIIGVLALAAVAFVAGIFIDKARGVITTESDAAGVEQEVYWRDYPGIAGIDPREVLAAAAAEDGMESARELESALRTSVTAAFAVDWVQEPTHGQEPYLEPKRANEFGGSSMLSMYYASSWQSTSVPHGWEDKQRLLKEFGAVLADRGFTGPYFDHDDPDLTEADRLIWYGGPHPEDQVSVSGSFSGPAGQWVFFGFQDLSKDVSGSFTKEWEEFAETRGPRESFEFSYGAPALLPVADRFEFMERLEPFAGLREPEARES